MKINVTKELRKNTRTASIVMHAITYDIKKEIGDLGKFADENRNEEGDIILDLKLTLGDHEIDLNSYFKRWQTGVQERIMERAKNLVLDKFVDLEEMVCDLKERLEPEIEKRLEDWEKECELVFEKESKC